MGTFKKFEEIECWKKACELTPRICEDPIWNEPVSTGNAGALARYEREARNNYCINKFEVERAVHAVRARAPALPALDCLFPAT